MITELIDSIYNLFYQSNKLALENMNIIVFVIAIFAVLLSGFTIYLLLKLKGTTK